MEQTEAQAADVTAGPVSSERQRTWVRALAALPMLAVIAIRLLGPLDLDNNDQAKQALYILDIYQHGNWILPQERGVMPATKPPLYAWLGTAASAAMGGPSPLSCRVPSVVASLALCLVLFQLGTERWKPVVGLFAAWIFAASHTAIDLAVHVRPDMVLTLLVTLALFALHRAELGRLNGMPQLFWISVALSILTKGPVGPLLILGSAVFLCMWLRYRRLLRPVLLSAWAWLLALPFAWALLAYLVGGSSYLTQTVGPETVDRVLAIGSRSQNAATPGYLFGHFAVKFLPWSVLALAGIAYVVAPRTRREYLPRFGLPVASFAVGLVLLNLSRGQRQDYILPLLPAASLVAAGLLCEARPLARRIWRVEVAVAAAASLGIGLLCIFSASSVQAAALLGPRWGAAILVAAAVLAAVWLSERASRSLRPTAFLGAIGALLLLHSAYNAVLSPVARSGRGQDALSFARAALAITQPGDRLQTLPNVRNSVAFLLMHNDPPVTLAEVAAFDPWTRNGDRRLLVADAHALREVQERWPGRFRLLLRQPGERSPDDAADELVLLEDTRGRKDPSIDGHVASKP